METKELSQLIDYETMDLPAQRIIINGQEQTIEQKVTVLKCPNCHEVIMSFEQEIPTVYIRRLVNDNRNYFENTYHYCPHCGQKLRYDSEIIDAEFEVVSSEPVEDAASC